MKKPLLSLLALFSIGTASQAQMRYTFTTQTGQTYTALTNGTDLTNGDIWDDDDYTTPLGFTFLLNGRATTSFNLEMNSVLPLIAASSNDADSVHAFYPLLTDFIDRAAFDSTSTMGRSPIRYRVDGSAPNRIFKAEFFNAGFFDDSTGTDSVNLQVWMYEGTNVIESRYGPTRLTTANLENYFFLGNGNGPAVGIANGVDPATFAGKFYTLSGSTTAPTLDSFTIMSPTSFPSLNAYPASGTVYRFTPSTTGTGLNEAVAAARALKLYPSAATTAITVEWSGAEGEAYQILSATGQQVVAGRLQRGTQSIPVNALAAGAYHLRLAAGSHAFVKQ